MSFRKCLVGVVGAVVWLPLAIGGTSPAKAAAFPDPSQFGTPTPLTGMPGMVSGITLTPDGQTMLFCHFTGIWQIYSAQWNRQANSWGSTQSLPYFSAECSLSPDGRWLFFADAGGVKIAERDLTGTWSNPRPIQVPLQNPACPFYDGKSLYVSEAAWE